ncbi:NDUFB1 isoform 6 [Pongo abelii]|uniref:NADH dehydrogenase [ubiquinone] 1 beta subcomplex subunit 1 n=3 Tax=Pongo TaxID=9599 RepID=NDUB1_PONPY|nr:RecName: Full=NADH dehydrogenase [ubiquinone] 1 beta subcomplex subunit 1; AltName: Full=Complex I-MNLL; Short=CI-MNLL; AltName: Full=NADH-ubiquinone oxidoreductase MNLL subunit [Pongo pygmaeus]ABH12219.1 mitochondrial complex I subunit NDUFB1 [Pongo pygmaeus]PNJ64785.1 NDUFB1 isoform 3 [Pongo abelii]PNJ64786.1 NDUFB1 isoform 4 [Pongo abelii]PNJ64787.1 NDUFB1 isoform 6 [Pongo abelii]
MVNLLQIVRDHWVHVLVPMGFVIGCYLDKKSDEQLTAFRNKSMLFKRELQPNEEVTWK